MKLEYIILIWFVYVPLPDKTMTPEYMFRGHNFIG
jgi:hypothetical protein